MYVIWWNLAQGACWGITFWVSHSIGSASEEAYRKIVWKHEVKERKKLEDEFSRVVFFKNFRYVAQGMSHSQVPSRPLKKYFCTLLLPFPQCRLRKYRECGFPLKILAKQVWCWEENVPWGFWICDARTLHVDFLKLLTHLSVVLVIKIHPLWDCVSPLLFLIFCPRLQWLFLKGE